MNPQVVCAITWQSLRHYARDKVFYSALVFSVLFVAFALFLSTLTIVETRKVLLDFGLGAISIVGVGISFFLGITAVGGEIEKRTIYTVLAKPVRRSEYLAGKFLGTFLVSGAVHVLNLLTLGGIILLIGEQLPAGLGAVTYLMVLESALLIAIALLFSLSTSSIALAASLSIAVFLIGRSSYSLYLLAQKSESTLLAGIAKAAYIVFPSLDRFDIREVVAYSKPYPDGMLGVSSLYFAAYLVLVLSVAFLIFRRKDLL